MKNLTTLLLVVVIYLLPESAIAQNDAFFMEAYAIDTAAQCNVFGVNNSPVPLEDGTAFIVGSLEYEIFVTHVTSQGYMINSWIYHPEGDLVSISAQDAELVGDKLIIAAKTVSWPNTTTVGSARLVLSASDPANIISQQYWDESDMVVFPKKIIGLDKMIVVREWESLELWDISNGNPDIVELPGGDSWHLIDDRDSELFAYSTSTFAGVFGYDGVSLSEHWYDYISPVNSAYTSSTTTQFSIGWVNDGIAEFCDANWEPKRLVIHSQTQEEYLFDWDEAWKHPRFTFGQVRLGLVAGVPLGTSMDQDYSSIWCGLSTYNVKHYLPVDQGLDWIVTFTDAEIDPLNEYVWVTGILNGQYHSGRVHFFGKIPAEEYFMDSHIFETSIYEVSSVGGVFVYPNPASDIAWFTGPAGLYELRDATGRLVDQYNVLGSGPKELSVGSHSKGVYSLSYEGKSYKLVIQ